MRNPTRNKPKDDDTIYISTVAADVLKALAATDGTSSMAAKYMDRNTNGIAGVMQTLRKKKLIYKTGEIIKTEDYPKGADVYKQTNLAFVVDPLLGSRKKSKKTSSRPPGEPLMYSCIDFYIYPPNYQRMF